MSRALIIGGGIGGLTAANALRGAGLEVAVFERANDLRKIQVGGTIIVWSNAMKALRSMGLHERVRAAGMPLQRDAFYSWRGELLGEWPVADMGQRLGEPTIGVGRGVLHRSLAESLEDGIISLDAQCTGFVQDGTGVTARFADGREERGDLLIGADGIKSTIRGQLLGQSDPIYAGYSIWQAHVETQLGALGMSQMVFGPGMRFVLAKLDPDHAHWFAVMNASETEQIDKRTLLERYRDWMKPTEEVIGGTDEKAITRMNVVDRTPARRWGEGRVTLLGDAAHPIRWDLGQGGSQAMEDAMVLARSTKERNDAVEALRAYEKRRIRRTALLTRQARQIGRVASWESPWACRLRDFMFKLTWNRGTRQMTEKFLIAYEA